MRVPQAVKAWPALSTASDILTATQAVPNAQLRRDKGEESTMIKIATSHDTEPAVFDGCEPGGIPAGVLGNRA